ncbi:MAG TPA: GNAT family N-acetyltransferase [Steroidobacteraceae bacterium]|nr:GNAT family N-acetyltransferase [Steroidobacteraceae bacterium]
MSIRPVDPAQARALIGKSDALMGALYPPKSNHFESVPALQSPNVLFLGAFVEDALVGCGAVKTLDDDGRYGEIKRLFVLEEHRGKGISKALMRVLESHLAASGVPVARLETGIRQPRAIALYKGLGYAERGPYGGYAADPLSVFMEKPIADAQRR